MLVRLVLVVGHAAGVAVAAGAAVQLGRDGGDDLGELLLLLLKLLRRGRRRVGVEPRLRLLDGVEDLPTLA